MRFINWLSTSFIRRMTKEVIFEACNFPAACKIAFIVYKLYIYIYMWINVPQDRDKYLMFMWEVVQYF